jgi:hypothetical protein
MSKINEGYIYSAYGKIDYLKFVFASIITLRRYDTTRKVALYCSKEQINFIKEQNLTHWFDVLEELDASYQSITGFKHNTHLFCPFDKNIFLDSDILFLKETESLWKRFEAFDYAVTGQKVADAFFGAPKNFKILFDLILQKRKRTLKRFGLTHLSRVQSGIIYISDKQAAQQINEKAKEFLNRKSETHFQSRQMEKGRTEESCEWSLAMSLSHFGITVFPWFWAENSAQLDFISAYTNYNADFTQVTCKYYYNEFVYSFRGLKTAVMRKFMHSLCSIIPGMNDYSWLTPHTLHFGWLHQKQPLIDFSNRIWEQILTNKTP